MASGLVATTLYFLVPGFFVLSTLIVILDQVIREPYGIFLAGKQLDKGWTLISAPTPLIPTVFSMLLKISAILVILYALIKVLVEGGVEKLFGGIVGADKQKPRID